MPLLQVPWDPSEEKHQHCLPHRRESRVVTAQRNVIISWRAINILVVKIPAGWDRRRKKRFKQLWWKGSALTVTELTCSPVAAWWSGSPMSLGTSRVSNTFTRARVPFCTRLSSLFVLKQRKRRLLDLFLKIYIHICRTSLLLPFYSRYSNMIFFNVNWINKKWFYTVFGQCHLISAVILLFAYHNVAMILTNPFFKAILVGKTFRFCVFVIFEKWRDI